MRSLEIKKDIYWVGALDPSLRVFDIIMYTPYGTTYNSYVIRGNEKVALLETVKLEFFDQYLDRLKSLDIDIHKIDYIIVDHTEPDHAGSVAKILELSPNAKIVGSAAAIKFMKKIANVPFESIVVEDGSTLSLGNKTLQFVSAPFLHWPDTIYTFVPEDKILFTCDSFGTHYCSENVFNDLIENQEHYMESLKYYFDCIMGPFKPYVLKAIDKIEKLDIDTICTGHGPILRENPNKIVELYKEWSTPKPKAEVPKVTISYVSAYGYTKSMGDKIAEGIKSKGNFEIKSYDVIQSNMDDIINDITSSEGVLFGSPTINSELLEPIRDVLTKLNPLVHGGKVAAAFGSYGWSGEAVPNIERRLKELRMNILTPGLKVNFKPSEDELTKAFNFGEAFAEKLLEKGKVSTTPAVKKKTRLWKCVICGEIFEGDFPPEICPVCGASKDQFVEVISSTPKFKKETRERFVIIGNGASGFYAAKAIRERNPKCSIEIVSKEKSMSYFRPQLSDYITTTIPDKSFYIAKSNWYEDNNIKQTLGVYVNEIIPDSKKILLNNGTTLEYDKLILANGSYNFIPPIKVACDEFKSKIGNLVLTFENYKEVYGLFTLKELDDAINVKSYIEKSEKAVIIGGGLLGLEAAWNLKQKGLDVTVVEFSTRLLPRQLDNEGADIFKKIADKSGINLLLGDSVEEIIADMCMIPTSNHDFVKKPKIVGLRLKSGIILETDMILFSVGIRPKKHLAEKAGLASDKGVRVNDKMETNIKDIYAAGDIAELKGTIFGNWPAAIEMGKVAGANAAGDDVAFNSFVSSVIFNALNAKIFSAGSLNLDDSSLEQLAFKDLDKGIYKKLFFRENILVGGVLIGNLSKSAKIIDGIKNGYDLEEVIKNNLL